MAKGWVNEFERHSLARQGIKTAVPKAKKSYFIPEPFGLPRELQPVNKFYTKEEEKKNFLIKSAKGQRYMNRVISTRLVHSGERDIYDYGVNIRETGKEKRTFGVSLLKKQKGEPFHWVYEGAVHDPKTNEMSDFDNKADAVKFQKDIVRQLKQGVSVNVIMRE